MAKGTEKETLEGGTIDLKALKELLKAEIMEEIAAKEEAAPAKTAKRAGRDPYLNEYVTVQLFKDGKDYKDDVSVHVNGENCVIRRGVPVQVKRKFALVLEQSAAQNIKANEYAAEQQQSYKDQLKQYNI